MTTGRNSVGLAATLALIGGAALAQPMSTQPGALSCTTTTTSNDFGQAVNITFTNTSDGPRPLNWVDGAGNWVSMGWLDMNASLSFDTNTNHVWTITDPPGNCLEMFSPQVGQTVYRVTVPFQNFGPE